VTAKSEGEVRAGIESLSLAPKGLSEGRLRVNLTENKAVNCDHDEIQQRVVLSCS